MPERSRSPLANLIGALTYGRRPEDAAARKRARGLLAWLSGGGFAIYIAIESITFGQEWVRHDWQARSAEAAANVTAMAEVGQAVKEMAQEVRDLAAEQKVVNAVLLDRLSQPTPKPVRVKVQR